MQVNFHLLQLLSSRICHDIIGPAGSLNFSFDILKDEYPSNKSLDNQEAIDMVNNSVNSLIHKLEFFRMCFGSALFSEGETGLVRVKELVDNLFKEKDVKIVGLDNLQKNLKHFPKNDYLKLILNIFLTIFYSIQRSGEIEIFVKKMENKLGIAMLVKGPGIKLSIDNIQAIKLELNEEDLTPRNIQSYFTALLSKQINGNLEVKDNMHGEIQFAYILGQDN